MATEIEKKFAYTDEAFHLISAKFPLIKEKIISDIYLDYPDHRLWLSDRYIRFRNGTVELKMPNHGQYLEFTEPNEIAAQLSLPRPAKTPEDFAELGMTWSKEIRAHRYSFDAAPYKIDVDLMEPKAASLFEIELMRDTATPEEIHIAEDDIIAFAKREGIFTRTVTNGKIPRSFQLDATNLDLYQKMVHAGIWIHEEI